MALLNPAAFYLLCAIPIVIALHFLKLRRKRFVVSSILLWRESAEDQKANVPFQRLRNLLLPLLQSIFLLLIVVSVARPALRVPGIIDGKTVYIIDNSASMQSKETGETRLTLAKQEVKKQIKQVPASGGMMIMTTHSPKPHIEHTWTTDQDKLIQAVENIKATDIGSRSTSVFDHAVRYVDSPQDQIVFISDSFDNIPGTSVPITEIVVGSNTDNIGIVSFNVEQISEQYRVLASIQNWTDTTRVIDARLELGGGMPIDEKNVSIPPKDVQSVIFSVNADRLDGEVISLHLVDVDDDFELDNKTWAILNVKKQFNFLLVSDREQPFLINLLRNYADNVELQRVTTDEFHASGDADVIIIDGALTLEHSLLNEANNYIFIDWRSELLSVSDAPVEMVSSPVNVISENKTHPIMQDVSLIGIGIKESIKRELPIWGTSLLETEKGTLIWLGTESGRRTLVLEFDAFNPEISPFATTIPATPLLIYQCLQWFESNTYPIKPLTEQTHSSNQLFRTGELLKIDIQQNDEPIVQVKKPDNTLVKLEDNIFSETEQIGVYSVIVGDTVFDRFAVNLVDADESALTPTTTKSKHPDAVNDAEGQLQSFKREVWHWSVLFAVGLLLCEWWFYHRT